MYIGFSRLINRDLFERSLYGKLLHFRCPVCNGIFAVKESKKNGKKPLILRCPDCGTIGKIQVFHPIIPGDIPLEKSGGINFTCKNCGEKLTIWAEGNDIYPKIEVFSCPFCGAMRPLKKI